MLMFGSATSTLTGIDTLAVMISSVQSVAFLVHLANRSRLSIGSITLY